MTAERVQKLIARAGVASRRKAEEMIRQGRVTVNGKVISLGDQATSEDSIKVNGRRVVAPETHHYFLLNKPKGYMTTRSDPQGRPTVYDLIEPRHRKALVSVGRLDFNTEGLLLMTDDGDFAQRVAHPRHGCTKTYAVKVKGTPTREAVDKLSAGVVLEGRRTAPAQIQPLKTSFKTRTTKNSWWQVQLGEGRTRQIREIFLRAGHPVQTLRRTSIGGVSDTDLPLGSYRELTASEVRRLGSVRSRPSRARGPRARSRQGR